MENRESAEKDGLRESLQDDFSPEASEKAENGGKKTVEDFISSLDRIVREENPGERKKKSAKRIASSAVRIALISVFAAIFIYSAYMLISKMADAFKANAIYSDLNDDFIDTIERSDYMYCAYPALADTATLPYGAERSTEEVTEYKVIRTNSQFMAQLKNKLEQYKEKNPDIFGWIKIDGTNISYAIVRGRDNDYYLTHTVTREFNDHGSIFADYRCVDDPEENENLVLYGHNSAYIGKMFHQLTKFLDKKFFEENKYITLYTFDGIYTYEIFSIYETEATYRYCEVDFGSEDDFVEWCAEVENNSIFKREGDEFTPESRILTLSTCTNGEESRRYGVHARLVSVEN